MTKILLVEDDKDLREIYSVRLLAEGYTLVSSDNGEEALAAAVSERPDLIISDVMMPKISGFEMLDLLKSNDATRDIPVIMLTALGSEKQRERGSKLGAEKYLVKSQIGIEDLVNAVHEVLGDRDENPGPASGDNAERLSQAVDSYNSSPLGGQNSPNVEANAATNNVDMSTVKQPQFTANASSVSFSGNDESGSVVVSESKPIANNSKETVDTKPGEPIIGNPSITASNFAEPQSGIASVFSGGSHDVTIKSGGNGEAQVRGTVAGTANAAQVNSQSEGNLTQPVADTTSDISSVQNVAAPVATSAVPSASQSPFNPPQATHPAETAGLSQPQMPDRPMAIPTAMDHSAGQQAGQPTGASDVNVSAGVNERRDYGSQGSERIIVPPTHRDGRTPRINIDELLGDVNN